MDPQQITHWKAPDIPILLQDSWNVFIQFPSPKEKQWKSISKILMWDTVGGMAAMSEWRKLKLTKQTFFLLKLNKCLMKTFF